LKFASCLRLSGVALMLHLNFWRPLCGRPPRPRSAKRRPKCRLCESSARQFTSSISSSCVRSESRNGPDVPNPAAATSNPTSRSPEPAATASIPAFVAKSAAMTRVSMPLSTNQVRCKFLKQALTTRTKNRFSPGAASRSAISRPMPEEAPVTTAQGPY
jgi:hypothetical protein